MLPLLFFLFVHFKFFSNLEVRNLNLIFKVYIKGKNYLLEILLDSF